MLYVNYSWKVNYKEDCDFPAKADSGGGVGEIGAAVGQRNAVIWVEL